MDGDELDNMGPGLSSSEQERPLSRARVSGFSPDRFRQARARAGLTQEDIAVAAQLDPTTISHWETGHSRPAPGALNRAARALGLTIGDFMAPSGERTLAQLRQQSGLNQREVAEHLNVPASTWGMIERGARAIGEHRIGEVAALLKIDAEELQAAWARTVSLRIQHAERTRS